MTMQQFDVCLYRLDCVEYHPHPDIASIIATLPIENYKWHEVIANVNLRLVYPCVGSFDDQPSVQHRQGLWRYFPSAGQEIMGIPDGICIDVSDFSRHGLCARGTGGYGIRPRLAILRNHCSAAGGVLISGIRIPVFTPTLIDIPNGLTERASRATAWRMTRC
jgi:hypothetical protein